MFAPIISNALLLLMCTYLSSNCFKIAMNLQLAFLGSFPGNTHITLAGLNSLLVTVIVLIKFIRFMDKKKDSF